MQVSKLFKNKNNRKLLIVTVVTTIIIGILWRENLVQKNRIDSLTKTVKEKTKQIDELKSNNNNLLKGVREALDENSMYQFLFPPQGSTSINNSQTSDNSQTSIQQSCQQDHAKYNSCLNEYNSEMLEYQSCLQCKQNNGFGCGFGCAEPYNNCRQYKPSSLCN